VRESDDRTGHLLIDTALNVAGRRVDARIECFARLPVPGPVPVPLEPGEREADGAVLVVGGSRGFGASLSLALLARGYAVHVAYSSSPDAASELRRLAGARADRLFLHRVDARDPASLRPLLDEVSGGGLRGLVLNAALVPLGMALADTSGIELADYVSESVLLAAVPLGSLLPSLDRDAGWVVFCSSSAVSSPPREWPHYVAAKGALEGLAAWLGATEPGIRTVVFRPPKMLTDLTNSPSGRIAAVPTDSVAHWLVAQLAGDRLAPGLTTLEPSAEELTS
jgi:NAD(P)-dependent dehydrogenase (short-subunit alcohol dehydrogenase family)